MNAIVGDNGIITQAQKANVQSGMAVLEEYLQEEYVRNYDELSEYDNRLDGMINLNSTKKYFQKSKSNEYYFLSPDTYKEYYFIEKSALPSEIQEALVGGNISLTGTTIYADFNDIYGITNDLKVFYCSDGYDSWLGAVDDATMTDLNKKVFASGDGWSNTLGIEGDVTLSDIRSIQSLTLSDSNIDLSKLENFGTVSDITINAKFENLSGIENCPNVSTIYIRSSANINDYSALGGMQKLNRLYFIGSNDDEISKFGNSCKEVDLNKLEYLCISNGDSRYYFSSSFEGSSQSGNITTIEPLSNLTDTTKKKLKYLCISDNKIISLEVLKDFSNIYFINARGNYIKSCKGIENLKSLTYLCLDTNDLGRDLENDSVLNPTSDALSYLSTTTGDNYENYTYAPNLPSLYYIGLTNNSNMVWIDYLKGYTSLNYIYLYGCTSLSFDSVANLKSKLKSVGSSISNKYALALIDNNTVTLNLGSQKIDKSIFLGLSTYSKVTDLNLGGASIYDGDSKLSGSTLNITINALLSNMPQLKYLSVNGFTDLTDFTFLSNLRNLIILDARNTGASTLNSLTGLELLNSITTFKGLAISGSNIDLQKLQPTLNRLGDGAWCSFGTGQPIGLLCSNWTSLKTLENCTNLTKINLDARGLGNVYYSANTLNLSNLTLATRYEDLYIYGLTIILPSSITTVSTGVSSSTYLDARNCESIVNIYTHGSKNTLGILETAKSYDSIKNLNIVDGDDTNWALNNMNLIAKCENLQSLRLGSVTWNAESSKSVVSSLASLSNLSELKNLTSLEIYKVNVKDTDYSSIKELKSLKNLSITLSNLNDISWMSSLTELETCNFNKCLITKGIKALEECRQLSTITLTNNSLYDLSEYNGISYNTCEVFANMNTANGGKLTKLYLGGNTNITDFSKISSLTWTGRSGF